MQLTAVKLIRPQASESTPIRHTPLRVFTWLPTLTLDSVVQVPLSLHGLLGHDLEQVVGMGDDLCTDYYVSILSTDSQHPVDISRYIVVYCRKL